jgi:hypothetical protein
MKMMRGPIKRAWNDYLQVIRDHVPAERKKVKDQIYSEVTEIEVPF